MGVLKENPLIEKINRLKKRFSDSDETDKWIIGEWEQQAKTAIIQKSLEGHEGVAMIIKHIQEEVKEINSVLISSKSKDLSDADRDRMIDMKNFYKWFLSFFTNAKEKIDEVNDSVDKELEE